MFMCKASKNEIMSVESLQQAGHESGRAGPSAQSSGTAEWPQEWGCTCETTLNSHFSDLQRQIVTVGTVQDINHTYSHS